MAILCAARKSTERAPGGFYPQTAMVDLFAEHLFGEKRVKILLFAVLTCIVWVSTCLAGERSYSPANGLLIRVGWQESWFLPRRFRNHCSFDVTRARYYCSNHCGSDYEFYYCSKKSFGCCHIGVGYCERDGLLRCHR